MTNPDVMIPVPFAQNGLKNPINVTRQPDQDAQDATWDAGFPPVTMQRKEVGGLPPNGLDFNGVLHAVSADANHRQKGLSIEFNQDFATAIGGYPIGAKLRLADGAYVESTVEGNTNNPNSSMTGWTPCVIDNLTTNDSAKPISAKQAKILQDNKLDASERGLALGVASLDDNKKVPVIELPAASTLSKGIVQLINDLTTGGSDKALTAEAAKNFVNLFDGSASKIVVPNKNGVPFIVTWFSATIGTFQSSDVGISATIALPVSMPNNVLFVIPYFGSSTGSTWNSGYNIYLPNYSKTSISVGVTRNTNLNTNETVITRFLVIGN